MLIKDFPIKVQKEDFDCGVAVLWCVLSYHGIEVSYKELRSRLKTSSLSGTSIKHFLKVCKQFNIKTKILNKKIRKLKKYIRKEIPIVCLVQSERDGKWNNTWENGHYVVIIGYADNSLYLFNPSSGNIDLISIKFFKKIWHDMADGVVYNKLAIACF